MKVGCFFSFMLFIAASAAPALAKETLRNAGNIDVQSITSSSTFTDSGNKTYKLSGIHVPPVAENDALQWLEQNIKGKNASLWHDAALSSPMTDRYGRALVIARLPPDFQRSIQEALIGEGLALAMTETGGNEIIPDLYAAEENARRLKKGIWAEHGVQIYKAADQDSIPTRGFILVEGKVTQTAKTKKRLFINFGPDWKTDFTLSLPPDAQKKFSQRGIDPLTLTGKTLRARGWGEKYNGPMIAITSPEQIEILPDGK